MYIFHFNNKATEANSKSPAYVPSLPINVMKEKYLFPYSKKSFI